MEQYVLRVLNKSKKALSLNEIYEKVERRIKKDDSSFNSLTNEMKEKINSTVDYLVKEVSVIEMDGKYKAIKNTSFYKGVYHKLDKGNGKVIVDKSYIDKDNNLVISSDEYYVERANGGTALDGDVVLVDVPFEGKGKNRIYKILDNYFEDVYGELEYDKDWGYCLKPVSRKLNDVRISISDQDVADNYLVVGSKIKVKINRDNNSKSFAFATVIEKFGHKDDPDSDVYWEALKYGMDDEFSDGSHKQVLETPKEVLDVDRIGRSDFTKEEIFTIDGVNTKDMDDAISIKRLDNGNYLLGVHIADVSHYVKINSPLDVDAYRKSTSTYAANTVIPMLPHELSNGICSLNPNVDRLTVSCIMEINNDGEVVNYNIVKSVINSKIKMNYDDVNKVLKGEVVTGYEEYTDCLKLLSSLALRLFKKRIKNGSIEFGVGDKEISFDKDGNMIGVRSRISGLAENLIEECMVVANETVDRHLSSIGAPCLHRVHDTPNEEKVGELIRLLNIIGYRYHLNNANECVSNPKCMQKLIDYISEVSIGDNLSKKAIQTMSRAKYSPNNIGHYGLGKDNYCHFTSPIRRYPDLVDHRLLNEYHFNIESKDIKLLDLVTIGRHASQKEKDADNVERSVLGLKCASFMQDYVGEDFDATVSDVTPNGLILELDNCIEGHVSIEEIRRNEEKVRFEPETLSIKTSSNVYSFGDRLNVKVLKNNDVLPLHCSEEDKDKYLSYISDREDKLDNKKTYLKINNIIKKHDNSHIKRK